MTRFRKHHLYSLRFGSVTWIYIIAALAMGFLVPHLNRWVFTDWISPVDKSTLTSFFSSIAAGMITLSGLVFSLIFVLVQFGSATYSPRITRIFAHTHVLHHSLGIFTGTFLYSLMAMRTIGMEQTEPVSGFTIWLGFIWLLASITILAKLVGVFATLTVTNILVELGRLGRNSVARVYTPWSSSMAQKDEKKSDSELTPQKFDLAQSVIYEGEPGYVTRYNTEKLLALATGMDINIELPYAIGDALKDGAPVALIYGKKITDAYGRLREMVALGRERIFADDPKYAIRLLVDTAIRSLSPAVNDPTTAVQALDFLESLLRRIGNSNLAIGTIRDSAGAIRVIYKTPTWEDYLQLGLSEIMQYGATSIQVERRLEALLQFLQQAVPVERAIAVANFVKHRRTLAAHSFEDTTFREWAEMADREGIGSQSDGLRGMSKGVQ